MTEAVDPFCMPAWAAVLFANVPVKRPDLPTQDAPAAAAAPAIAALAEMKKKRGRPFGTTKAAIAAKAATATKRREKADAAA